MNVLSTLCLHDLGLMAALIFSSLDKPTQSERWSVREHDFIQVLSSLIHGPFPNESVWRFFALFKSLHLYVCADALTSIWDFLGYLGASVTTERLSLKFSGNNVIACFMQSNDACACFLLGNPSNRGKNCFSKYHPPFKTLILTKSARQSECLCLMRELLPWCQLVLFRTRGHRCCFSGEKAYMVNVF